MDDNVATMHGGYHTRSGAVFGVSVGVMVLSTVFVLGRLVSRAAIVKKVTLDDHLMVLAWVC